MQRRDTYMTQRELSAYRISVRFQTFDSDDPVTLASKHAHKHAYEPDTRDQSLGKTIYTAF